MIKKLAWNTFKSTGSVDAFMELKQIENIEKNLNLNNLQKVETNGNSKNEGNNYSRK